MADIALPELHLAQRQIYWNRTRRNVLRCGRRFGKDVYMIVRSADAALKGKQVGIFAPEHKQQLEPFATLQQMLWPVKKRSSRSDGEIVVQGNGKIDFWTLNDNELAGRGREYDLIFINEAGFTKSPQMWKETWDKAIEPTLLIRAGEVNVMSTPNGIAPDNFFHACCRNPELEFKEFYAPSRLNPLVSPDELARHQRTKPPLVFAQEYLAKFIDWRGVAFFSIDKWMVDDQPVPYPQRCDAVGVIIDTALKDGKEHDATGALYFSFSRFTGHRVVLLDWEKVQIQGAFLEDWLPSVYRRLGELAQECGARMGALPPFIEDKGSGTVLLQQARRRNWQAKPLPEDIVSLGKDGRALSVSGYHYQGLCKISQQAFDKLQEIKGVTRNHLISEVTGFRLGDTEAYKRADELLDDYCYLLAVTCGDSKGF